MHSVTPAKVAATVRVMKQREKPPLPPGVSVHYGLFLPRSGTMPTELEGVTILIASQVIEGR